MQQPTTASSGVPAGRPLQAAAPVLLFIVVNRIAGLRLAVVVATAWSVWLIVDRRRKGISLGVFMPLITVAVIARGAIGAITGSESIYFGIGIATKYVVAVVLAGSIAIGRPLAGIGAPSVMQVTSSIKTHPSYTSAMRLITAIGALYYLSSATIDVWLFQRSSVEGFVLLRFLANWPLSTLALLAIFAVAQSRLHKIPGVPSLPILIERRMTQYWPQGSGRDESDELPQNG